MSELLRLTISLMLLSPLMASLIIALMSKRIGGKGCEAVGVVMGAISLLMSLLLWYQVVSLDMPNGYAFVYRWIDIDSWQVVMGVWVDHLSVCMAFMVASISWVVQLYSVGYMHNDPGYSRYFALVNFFTGAMLVLVMSSNMIQMFFAWEAMSVASYGLIGFWYLKDSASLAAFKAIMINRLGDCGLLMGILLWGAWGNSWNVSELLNASHAMSMSNDQMYAVASLMLMGVMSKSAQIPLHIWLPDSMEGPTPISALIHAATMVTVGVFWILRFSSLFVSVPILGYFLMVVGSVSALWMAILACEQDDLKRVIAYSTLSQLGIMIVAAGNMSYHLVLFHVFTHACTKAMLFLAVGHVIHCMHHRQSLSGLGGLRRRLPLTMLVIFFGSLSIAGIPPFSGFWSKDAIVHDLLHRSGLLPQLCAWTLMLSGAFTAAYMTRLFKKVFFGPLNVEPSYPERLNAMTSVLLLLLLPSLFLGSWISDTMLDATYWGFLYQFAKPVPRGLSMFYQAGLEPSVYLALVGALLAWNSDAVGAYVPSMLLGGYNKMLYFSMRSDRWYLHACGFLRMLGEGAARLDDRALHEQGVLAVGREITSATIWVRGMVNGKLGRFIQCMGLAMLTASLLIGLQWLEGR